MKNLLHCCFWIFICLLLASCSNHAPVSYVNVNLSSGAVTNGASNVPKQPMIMLQFSAPMFAQTVNASSVQLYPSDDSGANVALGDFIASNDLTSFSFRPAAPLQSDTAYTIAVTTGVQAQNGKTLAKTTYFSFTTGDLIAPTVVLQNPVDGTGNIPLLPSLQLHFSEAMLNVDSLHIMLHQGSPTGQAIQVGQIIEGAHNLYTMTPQTALQSDTTYYITFDNNSYTDVTDLAGNALTPVTFNFTTGDFTAPTVTFAGPGNNTVNVSTSPTLQVDFSEAVTGVNSNTVALHEGNISGPIVAVHIDNVDGDHYIITPDTTLDETTDYYLVLSSGITDTSPNLNPLAPTTFQFTTGDFTAPTAAIINPLNNAGAVMLNPTIRLHFSESVENVTTSTVSIHQDTPTGTVIPISSISVAPNDAKGYNITLQNPLLNSTLYYVVLTGGITDTSLNHNPLAPTTFAFTTYYFINQITAGAVHTCAITNRGIVLCWGSNVQKAVPPDLTNVTAIDAGFYYTCAVSSGTVHCWGNLSTNNQLAPPPGLSNVTTVAAGDGNVCVIKTDKTVMCWGEPSNNINTVPSNVSNVAALAAGALHMCALKQDGSVVCWGFTLNGATTVPADLNGVTVTALAAGYDYSCALKQGGTVECWGDATNNKINVPAGLNNVTAIEARETHTCAVKTNGTVVCWGDPNISVPTGLNNVTRVAVGYSHICALKTNGTVKCWGSPLLLTTVPVAFAAS